MSEALLQISNVTAGHGNISVLHGGKSRHEQELGTRLPVRNVQNSGISTLGVGDTISLLSSPSSYSREAYDQRLRQTALGAQVRRRTAHVGSLLRLAHPIRVAQPSVSIAQAE